MTTAVFGAPSTASVGDYFALLKPRVMSLVVFTGLAGIIVAPGHAHPMVAFTALLCIGLGAGASGALNMAYDADIDRLMARTAVRPVPLGRITREEALTFGWWIGAASVAMMALFVNELAAGLLAFTILFYVGVYTLLLKRRTPQNIVIGGLAGALPPAIGWAAVTENLSLAPLILVAIIFFWTPPHFWALALFRCDDYARAGVPMMPVTEGKEKTRRLIFWYTVLLVPLGLLPLAIGLGGPLYAITGLGLGGWMLLRANAVCGECDTVREPAARKLFGASILYLFGLFGALMLERLVSFVSYHAASWI